VKKYLSFGGGVNSTALMIILKEQGIEFEAVFADHGGDYPETYEYVKLLQDKGFKITVLKAEKEGLDLYDYCIKYKIMPSRQMRWCTDKFKIQPVYAYFEHPCTVFIGIDAGEYQRAKPSRVDWLTNEFPLIDAGIGREGCKGIIRKAGLPLPRKSGCYFCPFARVGQFKKLREERPELWCKTKTLEGKFNERRREQGKKEFYLKGDKPLDVLVNEGQDDLYGWRKPCQCGL